MRSGEIVKQGALPIRVRFLAHAAVTNGTEASHQFKQALVLIVDFQQGPAAVAATANRALSFSRIVAGMTAAAALPPQGSEFQH